MSEDTAPAEVTKEVDGENTPEAPARKTRGKAKATPTVTNEDEDRGVLTEVSAGISFYIRS